MATPITPETRVHLLSVPLEYNMKDTLWFDSVSAQETYFLSKAVKTNTDFTYQRKDKSMVVPYLVDDLYSCNYVMYQNHNFNNKWFYAFIVNMEYVDEETTRLYIETDPIQTWLKDYELKYSFVEREHTKNDTIGANTIPEGLETGDYIVNNDSKFLGLAYLSYVIGCTVDPNALDPTNPSAKVFGDVYNGIPSGISYYAYTSISDLQTAIQNLSPVPDSIVEVFIAPTPLAEVDAMHHVVPDSTGAKQIGTTLELAPLTTLNGHVVRNNKLFCYPYNFIKITNNQGQEGILKPELYTKNQSGKYELVIKGVLCPGCSIRMYPLNYDGKTDAQENGINLGKYPTCNWSTDAYTNWLTQNGVNYAIDLGSSLFSTNKNLLTGLTTNKSKTKIGALENVFSGVGEISKQLYQRHLAEIQPPQVGGNLNCGDVMTGMGENTFHTMKVTIKSEIAEVIDDYFDMFGYQTNQVKIPNYNHRANWWYTKTIDANITGNIPENDMERIKQCFNDGITFWKNPANMYNYNLSNSIVNNS